VIENLIAAASALGASDLHLEAGLPLTVRVRGQLRSVGDPLSAGELLAAAQALLGEALWSTFLERRSADLSRTIAGVRCRINILHSQRGVGFAIRLLASFQATIERLNLHHDFRQFVQPSNGLVLVSGPTGSGKSSTLAALIQEVNLAEARHILTIENPIEYFFRPQKAFIRQREVGRDTPSFEQALLDALREDPDVLMVGEMRDSETMRLTLNAAETGHLVLATVHSSSCIEALQRVVAAFPSESQNAMAAQLADCLIAVVTQRLQFRPDLNIRVPECEVLVGTHPVRAHIRNRDFFKIGACLETGADAGMWTFTRYRNWLERRTQWYVPRSGGGAAEPADEDAGTPLLTPRSGPSARLPARPSQAPVPKSDEPAPPSAAPDRIEIEPVEGGLDAVLRRLK
jgi:twitching motility protein PilT